MVTKKRSGFTLVEMLVVITVIGLLAAILLPAVNAARESARRGVCVTRLKQLGLAVEAFNSRKQRFPGYYELIGQGKDLNPTMKPHLKGVSWHVVLLQDLDNENLYNEWVDWDTSGTATPSTPYLELFICPSDADKVGVGPENSYVANGGRVCIDSMGGFLQPAGCSDPTSMTYLERSANGIFHNRVDDYTNMMNPPVVQRNTTTADDFKDGRSLTLLFTENTLAGNWNRSKNPADMNRLKQTNAFVWHMDPNPMGPLELSINGRMHDSALQLNNQSARPSSFHISGVNVVYADGHTDYVTENIPYQTYQQLMTPDGEASDMINKTVLD